MTIRVGQVGPSEAFAGRRFALPLAASVTLILVWQFRRFWLSGLDVLSGDIADTRIEIALMEHWLSVLRGFEPWSSPNFFHPWPGVLGFTDAFLLFSFPYGLMRALGAEPYLARELMLMVMRAIACVGCALVLRRMLRLPSAVAIFGGVLFALQNAWAVHIGHTQLISFFFAPWIVLALHFVFTDAMRWRRVVAGLVAGGLVGSLSLTSFTGTWYTLAFGCTGLVAAVLIAGWLKLRRPSGVSLRRAWPGLFAAGVMLVIGLLQFVRLYLPQHRTFKGYDRTGALSTQITPHDWFSAGNGNYVWGWSERWWDPAQTAENVTSLTPILFLTMMIGAPVFALRGRNMPMRWRAGLLICGLASVLWLLLITRFGPVSAWRLVYDYVPGGKGLRALGRGQLVLGLTAVPAACIVLSWLVRQRRTTVAVLLGSLLLAEQANSGFYGPIPLHALYRHPEQKLLDSVPAPPNACRVFYIVRAFERPMFPNPDFISRGYAPATDAMLLAQRFHLPTSNGVSTWMPPGWGPFRVDDPAYVTGMRNWLRTQGAAKGVCELDLEARSWTVVGDV